MMRYGMVLCTAMVLAGCAEQLEVSGRCATSRDCEAGSWCYLGACEAAGKVEEVNEEPAASIKIRVVGDAADPLEDGVEYGVGGREPAGSDAPASGGGCGAPGARDLVIHEVLARVPDGEAGDASGDGVRDAYGDEFVEIVNVGQRRAELGGVSLLNGERVKHTFEPQCLGPGEAIVVFGGAHSAGPWPRGVSVTRSQTRLGLSNSAGAVGLRSADGGLLTRFVYSDSAAMSYTLWPQLSGAELIPHEQAAPERLFSPGTCADGSALLDGCPQAEPAPAEDSADMGADL